ncbi:hypothetical protein L208DRAFT_1303905 [Tricholoma matsutake]|nr:hypothetical protein L208DRAFT_1303905 [Tricholoma matsutake 945]
MVDQSAGPFSPNLYIPHDKGCVHQLGTALFNAHQIHGPDAQLILWKSDVSQAYHQLPVHFLWQLHQVVSIDGHFHVDRDNNFGNRAAGQIWYFFFCLVLWIAVFVTLIVDLFTYVDNSFSWDLACNTTYYAPYSKHLPSKQAKFLSLLDEVGVHYDEHKQVSGSCLKIIGLTVDANAMTIDIPMES